MPRCKCWSKFDACPQLKKLEAELPGILNWAIAGCLEWQKSGLRPPAVITDAVRAYREESDVLGRFIDECCEIDKLLQVQSSTFFTAYQHFAEKASERWISNKDLPNEMERRGFTYKRTMSGRLFLGIRLRQVGAESHWNDGL